MKKIFKPLKLILFVVISSLFACNDNANTGVGLSNAKSPVVVGTKVYSGHSFEVYKMCINGIAYVAHSRGGIAKHGYCQ